MHSPHPPPDGTVLVALASADHRTLRAAAEIGRALAVHGRSPLIAPAGDLPPLDGVRAVVLGGAWDRPWARLAAHRFLHHEVELLRDRPLWIFDANPRTGPGRHPHPEPPPGTDLRAPVRGPEAAGWGPWASAIAGELAATGAPVGAS